MVDQKISIYTDGSCHTQIKTGAWVALIFIDDTKIVLSGIVKNTTNHRMELKAVIASLEYLQKKNLHSADIHIISDSQYVIGLLGRKEKLLTNNFNTKAGVSIQNSDLVQQFLILCAQFPIIFTKIKAHQNRSEENNYNREADKLARALVRSAIK